MMFMNTYEIDEAQARFASDPLLGPATQTLANLRDAADENSDGWCYWPKPCRAAKQLQELIQQATTAYYRGGQVEATPDKLKAAYRSIKAFRTRSGLSFTIEEG